jgi:hypothetical protein
VRLVTRHFSDLKGLENLPVVGLLASAGWAWLLSASVSLTFIGGVAGFGVGAVAYAFVATDTYAQLGRVSTPARSRLFPGLITFGILWASGLQANLPVPGPGVIWLAAGLYWLLLAIDGWPSRWYHALTCASAVYVAFGRVAVQHPTAFAWMASRLWVFCLTFLATSIADHYLLVRTVPVRPFDEDAVSEDADSI